MIEKELFYASAGGESRIHARLWLPDGDIRAGLQIVHGIAEHIGRYEDFAKFMVSHGFAVAANDHMGHGGSVGDGVKQYFAAGELHSGWDAAVSDAAHLGGYLQNELGGKPMFILGHSMGSFLTRSLIIKKPQLLYGGVILSGTGWQSDGTLRMAMGLCSALIAKNGERAHSEKLTKMMFGSYNKRFNPLRTESDWICSDETVVDRYVADPMCGGPVTLGLARDLLSSFTFNQKPENLASMRRELPVYFFSGGDDPVGDYGEGVRKSVKAFIDAGMTDVSMRLYPGYRHEMLNEKINALVYADTLRFLEEQLSRRVGDKA